MMRFWIGFDPRSLALIALVLSAVLLIAPFPRLLVPALLSWVMALTSLAPDRRRSLLKSVLFLGIITIAIGAWLSGSRAGVPWFYPTREGCGLGMIQALRVSALGAVMAWAVSIISVWRLSQGIEWSVRNSSKLRGAVHGLLFPFVLAWQMIPGFWDETNRQIEVYKLRAGPNSGGWSLLRMRRLIPGWIHGITGRAEILSEALTLRGYQPHNPPRLLGHHRFGMRDYVSLAAVSILLLGSVL